MLIWHVYEKLKALIVFTAIIQACVRETELFMVLDNWFLLFTKGQNLITFNLSTSNDAIRQSIITSIGVSSHYEYPSQLTAPTRLTAKLTLVISDLKTQTHKNSITRWIVEELGTNNNSNIIDVYCQDLIAKRQMVGNNGKFDPRRDSALFPWGKTRNFD